MYYRTLVSILALALMFGGVCASAQTDAKPSGSSEAGQKAPAASEAVEMDAPVITINGLCPNDLAPVPKGWNEGTTPSKPGTAAQSSGGEAAAPATATGPDCKTIVTRAEFEVFRKALGPNIDPNRIAERYPDLMLFAAKAQEQGLDKKLEIDVRARHAYAQVLSQAYLKWLHQEASSISDQDLEAYYKEHGEQFDEIEMDRIYIPKQRGSIAKGTVAAASDAEVAATRKEAEKIQALAAAGGDFEKLEEQVYRFVGAPDEAPAIYLGKRTRDKVPPEDVDVLFGLPIGKVSDVITSADGFEIVRVTSKKRVPLARARDVLVRLKVRDATLALRNAIKTQLNPAYFKAKK